VPLLPLFPLMIRTEWYTHSVPSEKKQNSMSHPPWNYHNSAVIAGTPEPGEPGPPQTSRASVLLVNKLSQQAKVLFIGACAVVPKMTQTGEIPLFLQMWDISDARFGTGIPELEDRALIVPDGSSIPNSIFDTNETDLSYASAMWQRIVFDMVVMKMNVTAAVNDANATITPTWSTQIEVQQSNFMVLGKPDVVMH
jgi:hypothetical protein